MSQTPPPGLRLSVVLATYQRPAGLDLLLECLSRQTLAAGEFEVVVVDDGSTPPAAEPLAGRVTPYALRLLRQENAGAAAARHRGVLEARGAVIVIVDDDMRVEPGFLAAHLAAHAEGTRRVVLGPIRPAVPQGAGAFERWNAARLDRVASQVKDGRLRLRGNNVCTGNVSLSRADYLAVGGFDPALRRSEDAELGLRLEQAGVEVFFTQEAEVFHGSDHDNAKWRARAYEYGRVDSQIAAKHPGLTHADPWRYLFSLPLLGRPLVAAAVLAPWLTRPGARLLTLVAELFNRAGLHGAAIRGAGVVYGMEYFRGLRDACGSLGASLRAIDRYLASVAETSDRPAGVPGRAAHRARRKSDLREDHAARHHYEDKYGYAGERAGSLHAELVVKIGLQLMAWVRLMRFFNNAGPRFLAKVCSRLIRHLYGSDIHWEARFAPGVVIVHGFGLAICKLAVIGRRCILSQNVTLGLGTDPHTGKYGGPTLEDQVHVGPGATLIGPIVIGTGSKVMPGCVVTESVPAGCRVEAPRPNVVVRRPGAAAGGVRSGEGA